MTGILHVVNQTPIEWYCRKQPTVSTATYSLESITVRSMTDQIIDLEYTLCMIGVLLDYHSYMFMDNCTIIMYEKPLPQDSSNYFISLAMKIPPTFSQEFLDTKKQYHIYAPYYSGAETHLTFP